MMKDDLDQYAAPDPYRNHLAALRAASDPQPETPEVQYKKMLAAKLAAEAASFTKDDPRLTTAEEIPAPPNPYAADLARMRSAR
jgi:hypothetical protein